MNKKFHFYIKAAVTIMFLGGVIFYVSPEKVFSVFIEADWRLLIVAAVMMPLFLFLRIYKWYLLVRQFSPNINVRLLTFGYLWGMALGLVTPGRTGEAYRVWASNLPSAYAGLFFLEKGSEVASLVALCIPALLLFQIIPMWVFVLCIITYCAGLIYWRKLVLLTRPFIGIIARRLGIELLSNWEGPLLNVRLRSTFVVGGIVQLIFLTQTFIIIHAMGETPDFSTFTVFPFVLFSNLVPINIGGFGLREAAAVALLHPLGISEAAALNGFLIVTLVDLALPCLLIGILFRLRQAIFRDHWTSSSE